MLPWQQVLCLLWRKAGLPPRSVSAQSVCAARVPILRAGADFAELTPDGARVVDALREAGSLEALLEEVPRAQRDRVEAFGRKLWRLGLLEGAVPEPAEAT